MSHAIRNHLRILHHNCNEELVDSMLYMRVIEDKQVHGFLKLFLCTSLCKICGFAFYCKLLYLPLYLYVFVLIVHCDPTYVFKLEYAFEKLSINQQISSNLLKIPQSLNSKYPNTYLHKYIMLNTMKCYFY